MQMVGILSISLGSSCLFTILSSGLFCLSTRPHCGAHISRFSTPIPPFCHFPAPFCPFWPPTASLRQSFQSGVKSEQLLSASSYFQGSRCLLLPPYAPICLCQED